MSSSPYSEADDMSVTLDDLLRAWLHEFGGMVVGEVDDTAQVASGDVLVLLMDREVEEGFTAGGSMQVRLDLPVESTMTVWIDRLNRTAPFTVTVPLDERELARSMDQARHHMTTA
jgi:hypothetical protein